MRSLVSLRLIARNLTGLDVALKKRLIISPEVSAALAANKPVVALESTIITHGMDYPTNLQTAEDVESMVRSGGAVPATIAIIKGKIRVGLGKSELEFLARVSRAEVRKCSRRDLAYAVSHNENGSTTVAATMYIAHLAGISVFATGGIGGVHRGAETTFDISADLVELSRTPVAVVSAGVKSILDIPKTLELLETLGVPVVAYRSEWFPDFYTDNSGLKAPFKAMTPEECAKIIEEGRVLGLKNGALIAVPIPKEKAADPATIKKAISSALAESKEKGIIGAAVTPFLLKRVAELTVGESVKSNVELIKNNAMVAAQIAKKVCELRAPAHTPSLPRVVLCGGLAVDIVGRPKSLEVDNSNLGAINVISGGCARNTMECIQKLGLADCLLISAVGNDLFGKMLMEWMRKEEQNVRGIFRSDLHHTATYMCTMQDVDQATGVSDMEILNQIPIDHFAKFASIIKQARVLALDSNLSVEALNYLCEIAKDALITFDPISQEKCVKLVAGDLLHKITMLKGNQKQMRLLAEKLSDSAVSVSDYAVIRAIFNYAEAKGKGESRLKYVIITGEDHITCGVSENGEVRIIEKTFKPVGKNEIVKTGGAGDALLGGVIFGLLEGCKGNIEKALDIGIKCAQLSVVSSENINPSLSSSIIN